jgi:hypothetical protein
MSLTKISSVVTTDKPAFHDKFVPTTYFESKVVVDAILDCIKLASAYGGKVFGGFVRDVIVPSLKGDSCEFQFKDVDIWFKSHQNAEAFIGEMGKSFVKHKGISVSHNIYPGAFQRDQYHLVKSGECLAWIDVIVSPTIPVNDFDVNEVTYELNPENKWVTSAPDRLVKQIRDKRATMLSSYEDLFSTLKTTHDSSHEDDPRCQFFHQKRINRIFISKGWTVLIPSPLPPSSPFNLTNSK